MTPNTAHTMNTCALAPQETTINLTLHERGSEPHTFISLSPNSMYNISNAIFTYLAPP